MFRLPPALRNLKDTWQRIHVRLSSTEKYTLTKQNKSLGRKNFKLHFLHNYII